MTNAGRRNTAKRASLLARIRSSSYWRENLFTMVTFVVGLAVSFGTALLVDSIPSSQASGVVGVINLALIIASLGIGLASNLLMQRSKRRRELPAVWRIADEIWRQEMVDRETLPGRQSRRLRELGEHW